ncbi:MAG TPA: PilT/PilU family type 4a pilus ATPase [Gammaproteobacteria bacterium]|nr:PilT/PilU family type 4a pilus ATPase [Gammaproteobacteria bacterium]
MDFDSLLKLMVHKNASDLFITAGVAPSLKINGKITPVTQASLTPAQAQEIVTSIMSPAQREEFERDNECNYAISASGIGRFRVSAFCQRSHAGMVLRKIETSIPTIEELRLPLVLRELAMTRCGLVIFVGATGSGKSTSLAAVIGYRNKNSTGHIITIEDPIEYIHNHASCIVTQREVGLDTENYEVALKNALRQAPDVIVIGEIRTRETMGQAIAFAETGHLCLATLHANNANQAMDRIINFFPEDWRNQLLLDLSLNMKAIVAQQLIPIPDGQGRILCGEVMINSPLMADLIRKGEVSKIKELMAKSRQMGMQTFDQALYDLYQAGSITYEDAINHADSANELRLMIKLGESRGGDVDAMTSGMEGVTIQETENF